MSIGLKRGTVSVEEHRTEWELQAQQTISALKEILKDTAVDIQHVGSTAIRGICAKPIIDIAVGVSHIDDILPFNEVLEQKGFIFRGSDLPGQYLYVCGGEDFRTHHIHIAEHGSASWKNYLNMRDYLNSHEDEARAYSDLKMSLAQKYPDDRNAYTAAKSSMVDEILRKARCAAMETVFESERILFVRPSFDLVPDYLEMVNDIGNVARYIGERREPYTEEEECDYIRDKMDNDATMFSMIEKETMRFIGNVEFFDRREDDAEWGIVITASMQDKGYGKEALRRSVLYGFNDLRLRRIRLAVYADNPRAIHVYEECGFREYDRNDTDVFMELTNSII